ncbi:MAG TPA: S41 family peptidase [Aliidongia sp.]|nr:S41 family peptidase [Aliidongia sp.]
MRNTKNNQAATAADTHHQLKAGLALAGLLLFTITACASSTDSNRPPAGPELTRALFNDAYQGIRDYYIDPVAVETLALSGMEKLDATDESFSVQSDASSVFFMSHGIEVGRLPRPAGNDASGWARVTTAAIDTAHKDEPMLGSESDEQLYKRVFGGIIEKLDRFTRYAGHDAARDQRASRDGYVGVGVTLDYTVAKPRVNVVVQDGPAAAAGVQVDDMLIAVDGRPVISFAPDQVTNLLRGQSGTKVSMTVERPSQNRTFTFKVTRELVVLPTVTAERDGPIAIFHLTSFNHNTAESLASEIDRLAMSGSKPAKGIVLDLRGDPGGLLDQAVEVADLFVDHGAVVSTRGRHAGADQYYEATDQDRTHGLPMVVLVNGGTASSAEIVAAALQDKGRAVVIGSSSFGKGTVQRVLTLPNDGELTLTWAKLVTPAGYILHQHGIVPTFCTSHIDDGLPVPEEIAHILDRGVHPTQGIETKPRAQLSDTDWTELRNACPTETNKDNPLDLKLAKQVLGSPTLYAQALSQPGVTVAHAEMHAARDDLQ